jgi:hypothetical protein
MSRRERSRAVSGGLRRPELAVSCAGSGCGGQRPKDAKAPVAPALLEPRSGFYAGGHAGGAWGNSTNASYSDKRLITERPDYAEANANYRKFAPRFRPRQQVFACEQPFAIYRRTWSLDGQRTAAPNGSFAAVFVYH